MNSANNYTGQLYKGQGRGIFTAAGTIPAAAGNGGRLLGAITETPAAAVQAARRRSRASGNQIEIVARGTTLIHLINGKVIRRVR